MALRYLISRYCGNTVLVRSYIRWRFAQHHVRVLDMSRDGNGIGLDSYNVWLISSDVSLGC